MPIPRHIATGACDEPGWLLGACLDDQDTVFWLLDALGIPMRKAKKTVYHTALSFAHRHNYDESRKDLATWLSFCKTQQKRRSAQLLA